MFNGNPVTQFMLSLLFKLKLWKYPIRVLCCMVFYGSRIERIPYSGRFHGAVSHNLDKRVGDFLWDNVMEELRTMNMKILPPSDHRVMRVESIARRMISAMNAALLLEQDFKINGKTGFDLDTSCHRQQVTIPKPIWTGGHLEKRDWEIYVVESETKMFDAFTIDGKIAISTHLLDEVKTDTELAFVIGHEIGHTVARHQAENLHGMLINQSKVLLPHDNWLDLLVQESSLTLERDEREADEIGLLLMASAGYHPRAAAILLFRIFEVDRAQTLVNSKAIKEAVEMYNEARAYCNSKKSINQRAS